MVAIFPGHTGKDVGAIDALEDDGLHTIEAVISSCVSELLHKYLTDLGIGSKLYIGQFSKVIADAHSDNCILGISPHCDSLPSNTKVRGVHTIIYPSSKFANTYGLTILKFWNSFVKDIPILRPAPTTRSDLTILKSTRFPVVLIEMGFLTNIQDEILLNTYKVRSAIAASLAMATAFHLVDNNQI